MEVHNSSQELPEGKVIDNTEYLEKMLTSKYGVVLAGRSTAVTDSKNRREIDYMMMKKPLLLNYHPYYYDPLIPGKHYIYIEEDVNIRDIDNEYDVNLIAENGYQWYLRNASPEGIVNSFISIFHDLLITYIFCTSCKFILKGNPSP